MCVRGPAERSTLPPHLTGSTCRYRWPVNAGIDAVTKADIVRHLMQFAIDGDLSSITAHVIVQRRSVARGHLRSDENVASYVVTCPFDRLRTG
jgi:hypothetical protein